MPAPTPHSQHFGYAWLALCLAFLAHVADEALTGFLAVYNPTVLALRAQLPWFPMPTFTFGKWLAGLLAANFLLLLLTPYAFRNSRWLRPVAWFFSTIMLLNALGHTLATLLGHTVSSVRFARPVPGFYSSPLLLLASLYLFSALRRSAHAR